MLLVPIAVPAFGTVLAGWLAEASSGDPSASGYATSAIILATGTTIASAAAAFATILRAVREGKEPKYRRESDKRARAEALRAELERIEHELAESED